MELSAELRQWRVEWIRQTTGAPSRILESKSRLLRQQRRLRARYVVEMLAALLFVVWGVRGVLHNAGTEVWLWAVTVWVTTIVATAFSIWNWRILWKSDSRSVSEYTRHYQERCIAYIRAARFGAVFLVLQTAIAFAWLTRDYLLRLITHATYWESLAFLACFDVAFWIVLRRSWRISSMELKRLKDSSSSE